MKRIEALIDAITAINGYRDPESPLYKARNPVGLKCFEGPVCTGKLRHYGSFLQGYQSGYADLKIKCEGKSKAKLTDQFHLQGLVRVYSMPDLSAEYIARFLRKALQDDSIKGTTSLSYFVEEGNG